MFQRFGCGISSPLWHSLQKLLLLVAAAALLGVDLQGHGDLGRVAGTPLMWQVLHVSGSCLPSWQRAQIDILFCETRATSSRVPGCEMLAWQVRHW